MKFSEHRINSLASSVTSSVDPEREQVTEQQKYLELVLLHIALCNSSMVELIEGKYCYSAS